MVYVEKKRVGSSYYYYHTRNIRLNLKNKKFRRYVGKDLSKAYEREEFLKSVDSFVNKELEVMKQSFIPEDLTYSPNILNDIFKFNSKVSNFKEFYPNIKLEIDKEFPIAFIYNSNSIEGSRLPIKEVEKIVLGKKSLYEDKNEIIEAKNSIECWRFMNEEFTFTLKSVKELHKKLTHNLLSNNAPYHQGFKQKDIVVGYDARTTIPSHLVKSSLKELFEWYKEHKKTMFGPQLAFEFYYRYELIHPFEDGNGRTGRFIMNKILIDLGFVPMIMYSQNAQNHHRAFVRAENGNKKYFFDFMFKQYRKTFEEFYSKFLK